MKRCLELTEVANALDELGIKYQYFNPDEFGRILLYVKNDETGDYLRISHNEGENYYVRNSGICHYSNTLGDLISEVRSILGLARPSIDWIPIKNAPFPGERVLLSFRDGRISLAPYRDWMSSEVLAWSPLPESYKEV